MKRLFIVVGALCLVFLSAITIAGDLRDEKTLTDTDFISCLYAGGHMVAHGRGHNLYPKLGAQDFYDEEFAAYTRALLNKPDKTWLFHFSYPAVVGVLCAPFALLPFRAALIAWQLFSVFALVIATILFSKTQSKFSALTIFLSSCMFLPVLQTIVVGQNSLVLGLFPLVLGYYLWQKKHPLACGLSWSLVGLKPQLALPVAAIAGTLLLSALFKRIPKKEVTPLWLGLIAGTFALHLIPCLFFGFDIFPLWLNSVKLGGAAFGAEKSGYWQYHLFCSVPCVSIISAPKSMWLSVRPIAFGIGLLLLAIFSALNSTILKEEEEEEKVVEEVPSDRQKALLTFLSVPLVFVAAPHLLLYDSCLLLLPAWIVFTQFDSSEKQARWLQISTFLLMGSFSAYLMAILLLPALPDILWQQILMSLVLAFIVFASIVIKRELKTQMPL